MQSARKLEFPFSTTVCTLPGSDLSSFDGIIPVLTYYLLLCLVMVKR